MIAVKPVAERDAFWFNPDVGRCADDSEHGLRRQHSRRRSRLVGYLQGGDLFKRLDRSSAFEKVGYIALVFHLREVNNLDRSRYWRRQVGFLGRMFSAGGVVVGQDHHMPTAHIFFASGRQAIAGTTERESERSLAAYGFDVLFAFGPIKRVRVLTSIASFRIEGIQNADEGHILESMRLTKLPARGSVN